MSGQVIDQDDFVISEKTGSANERFILEEDGVIIAESFSTTSNKQFLLLEDSTMVPGARARYEKTTQKNFADAFLLEDASQEVSTDSLILDGTDSSGTDAGFRLLSERDVDDAAAQIDHILLEDSTLIASEGQIPHASLRFSSGPEILNEDIPLRVIQLGSRAVVKSSVIEIRSS